MKTLTADIIERYDPCRDKLEILRMEWPDGMPVARGSLRRALKLGINLDDWEWFISESFPEALLVMYDKDIGLVNELVFSNAEYCTLKLEWIYYYLLGIEVVQLRTAPRSRAFRL